MIVTKEIQGFQAQNAVFENRVPNKFTRVHVMAQDLRKKVDDDLNIAEERRLNFRRQMLEARMALMNEQRKKG